MNQMKKRICFFAVALMLWGRSANASSSSTLAQSTREEALTLASNALQQVQQVRQMMNVMQKRNELLEKENRRLRRVEQEYQQLQRVTRGIRQALAQFQREMQGK